MSGLSARDRRTLTTGAIAIVALLCIFRGVPAWRERYAKERADAAHYALSAGEAEAAVRGSGARADSLDARRQRLVDLAPVILEGRGPAEAGGTLAAIVSGAAAQAGMQINSVQVRNDSAGPGTFTRVAVTADATGDARGIARMLRLLEGGTELLAVRSVSISGAQPGAPDQQPESLHLQVIVEGLALSRPASTNQTDAGDEDAAADEPARDRRASPAPSAQTPGGGR
jgi:hypothetical protein